MAKKEKLTASQVDGVQYRRSSNWRIALSQCNTAVGMIFYALVTYMSYVASEGYGIAMAMAGVLLTISRIFDGVIDPGLAYIMDRVNTKIGKIRIFMWMGWVIRSLAVVCLFVWCTDKELGIAGFLVFYFLYIIGSSICDIAGNIGTTVITNDPRQRPVVGVWGTAYSYLIPTILSIVGTVIILPRFDNQIAMPYLGTLALIYIPISLVFTLLTSIGVAEVDKPENFENLSAGGEKVSFKDMIALLKENRPFQMYILHNVSAKLAQQTMSQAIVSTLLFGILIGNIQLGTIISVIAMLPAIIFAILAAKFCGKIGSKKVAVYSMIAGITFSILIIVFCCVIDMSTIAGMGITTIVFMVLMLAVNALKMCVTTADTAMRSDVVDYELSRSGKYLPAVVTATYNFIDQFITSLGSTIAALGVAAIGYVNTTPQPTDPATPEIKAMALFLYFGIPIIGWLIGIFSMKFYDLSKERMVEVQKDIAEKKAELTASAE